MSACQALGEGVRMLIIIAYRRYVFKKGLVAVGQRLLGWPAGVRLVTWVIQKGGLAHV